MINHQDNHPIAALSQPEQECLRAIAGCIIPPSFKYGIPGADDPAIFDDLLASIRRDGDALRNILATVDRNAGGRLADLAPTERCALLARLRDERPGFFSVVEALTSRAYYGNDAVLRSIGMEPRPPFPKGHDLPQGDLSLLDAVLRRGKVYRDADVSGHSV
ncbi:hypothetical protein SAZ10_12155 [Mesorhizobium sp. BAC0120]|uniref:hypothetical protein n=1 Tax=Mesorhizobium sp. BAC0120 TaxID=3090670 RepID=UPI00298CC8E0|nr:hypothetical protein [Mesorhizobium sp. BAC0120]MDW6022507.1 hypothetical protein [Mesorhizobium sp. BAC0120]